MKEGGSPKLLFENLDLTPIHPILWTGLHKEGPRKAGGLQPRMGPAGSDAQAAGADPLRQGPRTCARTEKNSPIFESSCFNIIIPTKINKRTLRVVQDIPSLISNDFLEEHQIVLFFDPHEKKLILILKILQILMNKIF